MPKLCDDIRDHNAVIAMANTDNFPPLPPPPPPVDDQQPASTDKNSKERITRDTATQTPGLLLLDDPTGVSRRLRDVFSEFDAETRRDPGSTSLPTFAEYTPPSNEFIEQNAVVGTLIPVGRLPAPTWPGLVQPEPGPRYRNPSPPGNHNSRPPRPPRAPSPHPRRTPYPPPPSPRSRSPTTRPSPPTRPSSTTRPSPIASPIARPSPTMRPNPALRQSPSHAAQQSPTPAPRRTTPPTPHQSNSTQTQRDSNASSGVASYYFQPAASSGDEHQEGHIAPQVDGHRASSGSRAYTHHASSSSPRDSEPLTSRRDGDVPTPSPNTPPSCGNPPSSRVGVALPPDLIACIETADQMHSPVFIVERWGCFVRAPEGGYFPLKWYIPFVAIERVNGFTVYRTDDAMPADHLSTDLWLSYNHCLMLSAQMSIALEGIRRRETYRHHYQRTGLEQYHDDLLHRERGSGRRSRDD